MSDSITRLHEAVLAARGSDPSTSRTARLLGSSRAKMAKKLAEEAVEVVIDAMHGHSDAVARESADLIYNLVVLWVSAGVQPQDVWDEMARREKMMGIAEKLPKLHKVPKLPKVAKLPVSSAPRRKVVPLEAGRSRKRR